MVSNIIITPILFLADENGNDNSGSNFYLYDSYLYPHLSVNSKNAISVFDPLYSGLNAADELTFKLIKNNS